MEAIRERKNRRATQGDSSAFCESSDRCGKNAEPLRDWRRSSVLLHKPLMILANANFWSLCRNDDRRLL